MEIDRETLLHTFIVESEENLNELETSLIALESSPDDIEILQRIFRLAHTLKGNSISLGFDSLFEFANTIENMLDRFRMNTLSVTPARISLLLKTVDAFSQMLPNIVAGTEEIQPVHHKLIEQLAKSLDRPTLQEPGLSMDPAEKRSRPWGRRREDILSWIDKIKTLRVDISKLDRMMNIMGELAIARGRLTQMVEGSDDWSRNDIREWNRSMEPVFLEMQELVMKIRMVPIGPTFSKLIRTVRDIATAHNKSARLVIEGKDVEVDTTVIDHLKDPLTHLIRNAIDHGIEEQEIRKAIRKDPCGQLILKAFYDSGKIVIQLSDDGRGFDKDKILARARQAGIVSEQDKLSDEEIYLLVFESGFTTAESVTDLSGRGVGMDVVKRNIEGLRGIVSIASKAGHGSTITMSLPLTLAIIQGFQVEVGGEPCVIPLDAVLECMDLPREEYRGANGTGVINLRGEPIPYIRLIEHFGFDGKPVTKENVVIVEHQNGKAGLAVDCLIGETQAVIKPLGKLLQKVKGVSGTSVLGDGRVALLLDVPDLLRHVVGKHELGGGLV